MSCREMKTDPKTCANYEELFRLYYEGVTTEEHNEIWFGVHSDGLPHLEM